MQRSNPRMTILSSVLEPLELARAGTEAERMARAQDAMDRVGLPQEIGERYPHQLSGGQKQRVVIARALTLRPKLIVCDEVVAALDMSIRGDVLNLFAELQRDLGLTYVFITHDLSVVSHISDRIAVMYLGRFVELGPTENVSEQPLHPYTQALLSAEPLPLPSTMRSDRRIILQGEIPSPIDPPSGCRFRTRCQYAQPVCADSDARLARAFARSLGCLPFRRSSKFFAELAINPARWRICHDRISKRTTREAMALMSGALAGVTLGGKARAQGTPKRGGILHISAPTNPSSLDPATGGAGSDHAFLFTMYDTLTEWDFETLKPKPGLAESWKFTDPTTFVLNIQPGVTFHDGTPLDAEAVKFNLERNKSDPKSNIKADLATIAAAEVTGPTQVTLKLNSPDAALPGILSDRAGMMVSPTALKASAAGNVARTPVGAGAYVFVSWADGERIVVKRNEKYWKRDRPYPDGIEFAIISELTTGVRSVTAGQNDLIYQLPPRQKGHRGALEQSQGRQRADALCLSDFPELGKTAIRRYPGPQGFQLCHRPGSLRQGGARWPCRACLHESAEIALGVRQIRRRALSL